MPKKEYKILGFHGGLHNNSDAKDIRDIDLQSATGVSVHRVGRLVGIGNNTNTAINSNTFTSDIEPGYGLHYFSTDYNNAETATSEDWLAIYDKANTKVKYWYRDKANDDASPAFSSIETTFGANINPNYYYADGFLRIGDALHGQESKWFGYIDNELFWKNEFGTQNIHNIKEWSTGTQELKSLEVLIGDEIKMVDMSTANPSASDIADGTTKKLLLGYWTTEGGEWNGNYVFGVTPIYEGNQEGPISTIYDNLLSKLETTVPLFNKRVMFQVHIPIGTAATVTADAEHRLGDDRIIGLNWYFKEEAEEDWIYLMHTDLKKGGKHYWESYNSATETAYGIWDGKTVTNTSSVVSVPDGVDILENSATPATHINFKDNNDGAIGSGDTWVESGTGASTTGKSYHQVYLEVNLNNEQTNGFGTTSVPRKGFLRVWGGANSPLYVGNATESGGGSASIDLLTGIGGTPGTTWDEYFVPMTLPGPGTDREFRVEVLDENFAVIADSGIKTMTIADSGKVAPPEYEQEVEI